MKNEKTKATNGKKTNEAQLLELLKRVLPKATHDATLAEKIYDAIADELKAKARAMAFEKFCGKVELPDLEPKTIASVKEQLVAAFGDGDVTLKPNKKDQTMAVEVALPQGGQFSAEIKVGPAGAPDSDEQEIKLKFVAFPVCLPGDPELVWFMAKRETMTNEEAGIAVNKAEEEFWASKTGQKLIRDRVERSFPEFISRVPGGMLSELGLKRHYKTPEAIKTLRAAAPVAKKK